MKPVPHKEEMVHRKSESVSSSSSSEDKEIVVVDEIPKQPTRYPDMNFNPLEKDKENSKEDFGGQDAFEK